MIDLYMKKDRMLYKLVYDKLEQIEKKIDALLGEELRHAEERSPKIQDLLDELHKLQAAFDWRN